MQDLTGNRRRHIVRVDFVPPGEDDDGDHDEAEKEACDGGRHDGGRGQEEAVVHAEGSLRDEVHDHGEKRRHEPDDNALRDNRELLLLDTYLRKRVIITRYYLRKIVIMTWQ